MFRYPIYVGGIIFWLGVDCQLLVLFSLLVSFAASLEETRRICCSQLIQYMTIDIGLDFADVDELARGSVT